MGFKAILSKPFAAYLNAKTKRWSSNPFQSQEKVFKSLISAAKNTRFGKDHEFASIQTPADFKKKVPIRNYEALKPYIDRVLDGEENVLWPGIPLYLSKTSGTTSGAKYIPISKESIPEHINAARNAILAYVYDTGRTSFIDGKMIFLQGSPVLDQSKKVPVGRLSGIVAHHVPTYLQKNRLPSYRINCIEDWEEKVMAICKETMAHDMRLISGIPPWVQMYFERLLSTSGKSTIKELFPNFSLFIYGGVNYAPYRKSMEKLIGTNIDSIELYPASEGFIAYQDKQDEEGLLLLLDAGIYYEFIPADQYFQENPPRLSLSEVELGVNYALILSNNAGLWAYDIGDLVKFVSLDPFKIIVSGRVKHFTSAFGEHVIAEEVEKAIQFACEKTNAEVIEFHLAPQVEPTDGELPYHEWFIEFSNSPSNMDEFRMHLDEKMQILNPYYKDLIAGNILQQLIIRAMRKNAFQEFMRSKGKLGGQNKLPRLSNDRSVAELLATYVI